MEEKLTLDDFKKAKKALEDARIPEPWVITPQGIKNLEKMMEEMANSPKEEMGKRQPGELNSFEKRNKDTWWELRKQL